MVELNKLIGERLKIIRFIFNEGGKLSAEQFAFLVGETKDKILNYELGRASVPIRMLYELYRRGINPTYIITGEGSMFAENSAGKVFTDKLNARAKVTQFTMQSDVKMMTNITNLEEFESNSKQISVIRAAAGDIHKAMKKQKDEKTKLNK